MSLSCPAPHEIRMSDGSPAYRCYLCGAAENLSWFLGTSCPVCPRPECRAACGAEYQRGYDELSGEGE
jgi:hypothetical protein